MLLVCGIVTYVSLLETIGTIDWLGEEVAALGTAMIAALLICYIGGVVSAFASTTGILGALIPLAVPFLQDDSGVGAIGLITALAISSSVVDSARSPPRLRWWWPTPTRRTVTSSSAG